MDRRPLLWVLIFITGLFFSISCEKDSGFEPVLSDPYTAPPETGDGWETATPNEVGMSVTPFQELEVKLAQTYNHEIHSVLVVKDNKLVYEKYYPGHDYYWSGTNFHGDIIHFNRNTTHCTHSVTKSFASALVGIAQDKGYLQSVDQKVFDFFPELVNYRTQEKGEITIEHCLMMSSGLSWNEWESSLSNTENDLIIFCTSGDPIGYVLRKPLVHEPGTVFYYNGGTTNVLGQIVRRAADTQLDDFSGPNLFEPLGVTQYEWLHLARGITYCSGDLELRPRDMAKFGQLYLDGGVWNEQRIISEEWVDASTTRHVPLPQVSWAQAYGYQWWMNTYRRGSERYDAFFASGWGGQMIFVFPEIDMVCVFTGANYTGGAPIAPETILTDYIFDALD